MFLKYTEFACILSCFNCVWLFETLWSVACRDPLSLGFSRQEYWSELSRPPPGDLPDSGFDLSPGPAPGQIFASLALQENSFNCQATGEAHNRFDLKKKTKNKQLNLGFSFQGRTSSGTCWIPLLPIYAWKYYFLKKVRLQKPNSLNIITLQTYSW